MKIGHVKPSRKIIPNGQLLNSLLKLEWKSQNIWIPNEKDKVFIVKYGQENQMILE